MHILVHIDLEYYQMIVLRDIQTSCISLLKILKRFGRRLVRPLSQRNHMTTIKDTTEKHGDEGRQLPFRRCSSEKIPVLGTILKRRTSCPSELPPYSPIAADGAGTAQADHSGQMSAITQKISEKQETASIGKTRKTNFLSREDGVGVTKEQEEGSVIQKRRDVKRKISGALTMGITGAKIASLFFTLSSLIYSSSAEIDALDDELEEM